MATLRLLKAIMDGQPEEIREAAQQFSREPQCAKSKLDIIAALVDRNDDEITRLVFTEAKISLQPDSRNGRTLLHDAAEYGNPAVVRYLLSQGLDVNAKCNEGSTPLHLTTDCAIAELLIQHGADINQVNGENETLLHIALGVNDYPPVKRREDKRKLHALINFILKQNLDTSDRSVLKAALYSYFESEQLEVIIESLLNKGFTLSDDDIQDDYLLRAAIDKKLNKFSKWLLDHNSNLRDNSYLPHDLVLYALRGEWFSGVEMLLDHGADINVKDDEGRSYLHMSLSVDMVRMLVSKGADIHSRDNDGKTPLHYAETREVIEYYLSQGADVNAKDTEDNTILDIHHLNPGMASLLISKGAHFDTPKGQIAQHIASKLDLALGLGVDIDSEVHGGDNLLHLACVYGDVDTVWKLLKSGANVNRANDGDLTPLHNLVHHGPNVSKDAMLKMVDILLDYGADLNLYDGEYELSPFHHLVEFGFHSKLDWFLARGANLKSKTRNGDTILHLTMKHNRVEVAEMLLACGADINANDGEEMTPIQKAQGVVRDQEEEYFRHVCLSDFEDHIDLFSHHIIKMTCLGLYVCDENIEAVSRDEYFHHERKCRQELDLIGRISLTGNVSPVDILRDKYPECIFNETDSETIRSLDLLKFPCYGEWIQVKYSVAKGRFDRMEASKRFLSQLIYETGTSKGWRVTCLPIELINKILSYLSIPHLRKLGEELLRLRI